MSASATLRHWIVKAGATLALLVLCAPVAAAAPTASTRIVAVGDLHGDYAAFRAIARDSGLIDAGGRWTGGQTVFVQLGDIADRGPDTLKIINDLKRLQKESAKAGGKVIVILGNHEAMNVSGDLRYVSAGEYAAFVTPQSAAMRDSYYAANRAKIEAVARAADASASPAAIRDRWFKATPLGWVEHRRAWAPDGPIGAWAKTNPAIVKIDGNLFVHGGISSEASSRSIDQVNRTIANAMAKADDALDSPLTDPLGPLWYRGLVTRDLDAQAARAAAGAPNPGAADEVATVLKRYGAKRIVVGHTPNLKGVLILMDGKLVRTDTGNSGYYGGQPSWLEILGDTLTPHSVKRTAQ